MGDLSRIKGNQGQKLADEELVRRGVAMVRSIPTLKRAGRYVRTTAADTIGIIPGTGQSVIMEIKAYDGVLQWSALRDDQHQRLAEHSQYGGISLIGWVNGKDVYIMQYPVAGFAPRRSITPEMAQNLQWYAPVPQKGFVIMDGQSVDCDCTAQQTRYQDENNHLLQCDVFGGCGDYWLNGAKIYGAKKCKTCDGYWVSPQKKGWQHVGATLTDGKLCLPF